MNSRLKLFVIVAIHIAATITAPGAAQTVATKPALTLAGARQVIAAAVAEAAKSSATGVIAVVDDGGNLMALERLDNTFAAGATISIGKARTAALFKKPTKFFEDVIKNGRTAMAALPSDLFTPLQGGIPLVVDGQVVGGVGVSGASSAQQDEEFAIAGANALKAQSMAAVVRTPVATATHLDSVDVTAAFAKGMPLIENGQFKVHASRREKPGQAEVHSDDTDVIYVLEGTATFIVGGTVTNRKAIGTGEYRGATIEGGETRTLKKGDVVVVPNGVPHWFKEVNGPLLYYVVKVTMPPVDQAQAAVASH
jgi:uncharacterized protein GlcG (DUF336 family)/quercetin dioxygenase-like cupin family protein